jgi:endonuclease/exonuclease/phosphatase family metal-dependent hydrolase
VLRGLDADVVALQEVTDPVRLDTLADELGMHAFLGRANSDYGVAWLSREPAHVHNHRLPVLDKTLLELEWRDLRLFATHLRAGRTPEDEPPRVDEVRAILDVIRGRGDLLVGDFNAVHPDDEVGSPPPDEEPAYMSRRPIAAILESGFTDAYRTLHDDEGWTYRSMHLFLRLDFVFAGARLRAAQCRVVTQAGEASDHLPVFAELT